MGFLLILLVLWACDAPHQNSLDPISPHYRAPLSLTGMVQTQYAPNTPIEGAMVHWLENDLINITDSFGNFSFDFQQESDSATLIISKTGFLADTLKLDLSTPTITAFLNQIPQILDFEITSLVINQYPNLKNSYLELEARIHDSDQDTDSVWVTIPGHEKEFPLSFNPDTRRYETTLSTFSLDVTAIESLQGHLFELHVQDLSKNQFCLDEKAITRIIDKEIQFDRPANYETVESSPVLSWQPFDPSFPYHINIEIMTDDLFPRKVWEKKEISSDLTSIALERDLDPGEYYWVLWCVDEFNNSARSKPASFVIRN